MPNALKTIKDLLSHLSKEERLELQAYLKRDQDISLEELLRVKASAHGLACPECGSTHVVRNGKRNGMQRYFCKRCKKSFNELHDTFLQRSQKDLSVWKTYIQCMVDGKTIRDSAIICDISPSTAFYWRHKILDIVYKYLQGVKIRGVAEMDDMFFPLSYKGSTPEGRDAKKRGTPDKKRGVSDDKICVTSAIGNLGKLYATAVKRGRVTYADLNKIMKKRLEYCRVLVTDKDSAYRKFARTAGLKHVQIKGDERVKGIYSIQRINAAHSRIRKFMRKFCGVASKYLNNYLSWEAIIVERRSSMSCIIRNLIRCRLDESWHDVAAKPAFPVVG